VTDKNNAKIGHQRRRGRLEILLLLAVAAVFAKVTVEQLSGGQFFCIFLVVKILHRFCNRQGKSAINLRFRNGDKKPANNLRFWNGEKKSAKKPEILERREKNPPVN
jgi:hypothetical protein